MRLPKNDEINELLRGAIDMHFHSYPEFALDAESRLTDIETLQIAKNYGMRGIVFKSHMWPTTTAAYYMRQQIEGIDIFPSITLNAAAGGISAWAVESAARQGAKVVWMPTWSSKSAFRRLFKMFVNKHETFRPEEAITILDDNGKLKPNVCEVIEVVKQFDLPLFTGHISIEESLALVKEARAMGLEKIVLDHFDGGNVNATEEQVVEFAQNGGFIEYCALGVMPTEQRLLPDRLAKIIQKVGADHFILDTDCFFNYVAPGPEMLRMLIGSLLRSEISFDDIRTMVRTNPCYLLNISPEQDPPSELSPN